MKAYIKQLEEVIMDLTNGESWYDIRSATAGLSEIRCKEIEELSVHIFNKRREIENG